MWKRRRYRELAVESSSSSPSRILSVCVKGIVGPTIAPKVIFGRRGSNEVEPFDQFPWIGIDTLTFTCTRRGRNRHLNIRIM